MGRPRKNKLNSLAITDGQIDRPKNKLVRADGTQIISLDMIWGDDGTNKYKTSNETEYNSWLDQQNLSDLQTHAAKLGVNPVDNRGKLKIKLVNEFKRHYSQYKVPSMTGNKEKKLPRELADFLAGY